MSISVNIQGGRIRRAGTRDFGSWATAELAGGDGESATFYIDSERLISSAEALEETASKLREFAACDPHEQEAMKHA